MSVTAPGSLQAPVRKLLAGSTLVALVASTLVAIPTTAVALAPVGFATTPARAELNPIAVEAVRATGAMAGLITSELGHGLGDRGVYELPGLDAPEPDGAGDGLAERGFAQADLVGLQWKPEYGWTLAEVEANRPDKIDDVEGGLRLGASSDRIEIDPTGLTATTQINDAAVDVMELNDKAGAVLQLTGDAAKIVTAAHVTTVEHRPVTGEPTVATTVEGLTVLGEPVATPDGLLAEPVTRSHAVESDDFAELGAGLGLDPEDIAEYADLIETAHVTGELEVTVSTPPTGGLDVRVDMVLDLRATSVGAGALLDVHLVADNQIFAATFAGEFTGIEGGEEPEPVDPPTVTGISTDVAVRGDRVTVTGTFFVPGATSVTVGGVAATDVMVSTDGTEVSFLVPTGSGGTDRPVVVSTPGGSVSAGTLTVTEPLEITRHPEDLTIDSGQDAVFTAAAAGSPAPTVVWQFQTALGGAWTTIDASAFPSAATPTLTLPASVAWDGLKVRAVFTDADGIEAATTEARLMVNQSGPIASDSAALASPLRIGAQELILSGEASGGTFAGLINAELASGFGFGEPGTFRHAETGTPRPGQFIERTYPAGQRPSGPGVGDLPAGVVYGPTTVRNEHDATGMTSTVTVESFTVTDKAFDDKGRIGGVIGMTDLVEATGITATVTAPDDDAQPTTAVARVETVTVFGEELTADDGLVDGQISEPITKTFHSEITDVPAVLESMGVEIGDYIADTSELVGVATAEVDVVVSQPTQADADVAVATGLHVEASVELTVELNPVGSARFLIEHVLITSGGKLDLSTSEVGYVAVARNGAELPAPGEGEGPDPEPEPEPEPELPFVSYQPTTAPDRVILTPAEENATAANVTWRTAESVTAGEITYWPTESGPAAAQTVPARTGESIEVDSAAEGSYRSRSHSVQLTGLTPGTSYTYRVGLGEDVTLDHTFTTAAASAEPFSFMYLGDAQNDLRRHWDPAVKEAYAALQDSDLVLHAGDLINHADMDDQWGEWFGATPAELASIVQLPVAGNHEYVRGNLGPIWRESFTVPHNGPVPTSAPGTCELLYEQKMTRSMADVVYYTDYQGVRFVTLGGTTQIGDMLPAVEDLAQVDCAEDFNMFSYWFQIQADWLDEVLEDNPGRWSVVSIHQPVFSTSTGRDNSHLREALLDVIESHDVDLVLQGHDHTYGRGHLKANNVEGSRGLQSGPVYVVSVLGPKSYDLETGPANNWTDNGAERVTAYEKVRTYQDIAVDGGRLHYRAIEWESGDVVDEFEICKSPSGAKVATKTGHADLPQGCDVDTEALVSTEAPEILGTPEVGQTVHATRGLWSLPGVEVSYQWLRDGAPIAGATARSYAVGRADLGAVLAVRVDASVDGRQATATSAPGAPVRAGIFASEQAPVVSGRSQVGHRLSVGGTRWSQQPDAVSYQWLRDGAAIAGATSAGYVLAAADHDATISVRLTARLVGFEAIAVTSGSTAPVAAGVLTRLGAPTIKGTQRVGKRLTATTGSWSTPVTVGFQWLRNGQPIAGATTAAYTLTPADHKGRISVRVSVAARGFVSTTTTSATTGTIEPAPNKTVRKPKVTGKALVGRTVRVKSGAWSAPKARVTYQWLRNGKAIKGATKVSYRIKKADTKARLKVRVTVTAPGYEKVRVTATLSGRVKPKQR